MYRIQTIIYQKLAYIAIIIFTIFFMFVWFKFINNISLFHFMIFLLISLISFIILREYKGDLFNPIIIVSIYFTVYFVISASVIVSANAFHSPHIEDTTFLASKALLYVILALLFIYIGYKSNLGNILKIQFPVLIPDWNTKRALIYIIFFFIVGLLSYWLLIHLNGGFYNYITHIGNRTRLVQGKGHIRVAIDLIPVSMIIGYILYIDNNKTFLRTVFLFFLIISFIITGLTLGDRAPIIHTFFSLLFIKNYLVNKNIRLRTFAIIALIAIPFLIFTGALRQSSFSIKNIDDLHETSSSIKFNKSSLVGLFSRSFDSFDTLMALIERVPDKYDFYWGRTYLRMPLALIPRAIYPSKPAGAAFEISYIIWGIGFHNSTDLDDPQSASSINMIHELYLNFSLPGIIFGCFIYGVLLKAYYSYLLDNIGNKSAILIGSFLFYYMLPILGESFMFIISFTPIMFVLACFYLFTRQKET
jgi:oligosaccharide repeat unit polymerase